MAGPWEKYQSEQDGPWTKYAAPAAEQPRPEAGLGRTVFEQGMQGATLGLSDEVMDRIGAGIASLATDESYSDLLDEARGMSKERMQQQWEDRPVASIISGLAGGVATGGIGGTTKTGKALVDSLGRGGLGARMLKGAGVGATTGGAYGFGAGSGDAGSRLESAAEGALLGSLSGGAIPAAGALVKSGVKAVTPTIDEAIKPLVRRTKDFGIPLRRDQVADSRALRTLQKTSQELPFSGADDFERLQHAKWNQALVKTIGIEGDAFTPETVNKFFDKTNKAYQAVLGAGKKDLSKTGLSDTIKNIAISADELVANDVSSVVSKNAQKVLDDIIEGTVDSKKIASIRNDLIKKSAKATPEARVFLGEMVEAIDDAIAPTLNKAQKNLLQKTRREYRNFKTIEPLIEKSTDGVINPTQLQQRVAASKFIKAGKTALGEDDLVDLARIGKEFMPKLGGSDTYQKLAYGAGGGGIVAAAMNPAAALSGAALAGSGLAANRALQKGFMQSQKGVERMLQATPQAAARSNPYLPAATGAGIGLTRPGNAPVLEAPGVPTRVDINQGIQGSAGNDTLLNSYPAPTQSILDGSMDYEPMQPMLQESTKINEGFSPTVYPDPIKGNKAMTVGYGFNMDSGIARNVWKQSGIDADFDAVKRGEQAITPMQAERLGAASFQVAVDDAMNQFPDLMDYSPARQEALLDLSYQLGASNLAEFSSMKSAIKQGKWTTAARHLLKSKYAKQVPNRAQKVARAFING